MCGIIGYLGNKRALEILLDGLEKLEYRGYDSCGLVVFNSSQDYYLQKTVGSTKTLREKIKELFQGNWGIAHTRWATHGGVTDFNAHPHFDCHQEIFVVHNGIIENFKEIKQKLLEKGHKFSSETDTEVFAHLVEDYLKLERSLEEAIKKAIKEIEGTFAFLVVSKNEPEKIIGIKKSSPLILGVGKNEYLLASDPTPISFLTKNVVYLDDYDMVILKKDGFQIFSLKENKYKKPKINSIDWEIKTEQSNIFEHYMLKEIFEEAKAFGETIKDKIQEKEVVFKELKDLKMEKINKIILTGCGTAYYACLYGKYLFEDYLKKETRVEIASELRYENYPYDRKTLFICISQSGETIDTLEALKIAKEKGAITVGIINVPGSSMTRIVDYLILTKAGPELAVASTKAFISQLAILYLLAFYFAKKKNPDYLYEFLSLRNKIEEMLAKKEEIENLAKNLINFKNFYYLGRKYEYPIALEGALKLKEIAYVHAEGYPAGEMKHGPIALIDENFPTFILAPQDSLFEKSISNLEEIKARKGKIILISDSEKNFEVYSQIKIPQTKEEFYPFLIAPTVHLFAYYFAKHLKREIDRPRNLAKSVTVE